jgi:hypothetical protein
MSGKSLLMVGALAVASLNIASAKSYEIVLNGPAKAGATELKAGEYKIKIEGSQAVFTDEESAKSFTIPVQVENGGRKFRYTSVETTDQDGIERIHAIELGGSTTRVTLGQ